MSGNMLHLKAKHVILGLNLHQYKHEKLTIKERYLKTTNTKAPIT
jgi:hypothetical protein